MESFLYTALRAIVLLSLLLLDEDPVRINNDAVQLLDEGRYDQAIAKLITARNLDPESKPIRDNLAAAYAQRGVARARQGNYLAAVMDLESACKQAPDNPSYRYYRASYLYRMGELPLAEAEIARLEKVDLTEELAGKVKRLKGNVLYLQDRLDEAFEVFKELAAEDSADGQAQAMRDKIERELEIHREYRRDVTTYFNLYHGLEDLDRKAGGSFVFMLEKERSKVCSDLNHFPRKRITVIIYDPDAFKAVTLSEGWVGGLFDRKIRIPVSDLDGPMERIRQVVRHEYTHVILYELAPGCPAWINEGLACLEQYSTGAGERSLRSLMRQGQNPLPFDDLPDSFFETADAGRVRLYYAQSHAMVEYLVEHYGMGKVRVWLRELNQDGDWKKAFRRAFARDFSEVETEWYPTLK